MKEHDFETRAIHTPKPKTSVKSKPIASPIIQTTSFEFEALESLSEIIGGQEKGFGYSRAGNPTVEEWELSAAQLEGAEAGVAFGAGVAAIYNTALSLCQPGDHIVAQKALYGGSQAVFTKILEELSIETTYVVDYNQAEAWTKAIRPNTRMVFAETLGNPTLVVPDLQMIADVTHQNSAKLVVDSTFTTPFLRRPLESGADIVVHSATKYMGGHGDLSAGIALGNITDMNRLRGRQILTGATVSPFVAWLTLRGMKTLGLRMRRHCESALQIAQFLEEQKAVEHVYYPGLESHPDHARAKSTLPFGCGGVVSFELKGDRTQALRLINNCKLFKRAGSLGDAHSLITLPAMISHQHIPRAELLKAQIPPDLIRLSIGLESSTDLIQDLEISLKAGQ